MRTQIVTWVVCVGTLCGTGGTAFAQVDVSGEWALRMHEDQQWRGPGQRVGEFEGLPIKAAKVTFDYDRRYSKPQWTGEQFVESIVATLKPAANPGSR